MEEQVRIRNIVENFLLEEKMPLNNALAFGSLGLSKAVGDIARITYGVGFSGHPYNDERKSEMAEFLGDLLFYWHVLAISSGIPWTNIMNQWVSEWLKKNMKEEEIHASLTQMMKYLKTDNKKLNKGRVNSSVNILKNEQDLTK
ncbi:MAG: hypothetical protein LBH47_02285 [Christensenellaceae bacterium]|jgi:hypothetical protein|nr:hypothetical protein [Christensenellaceae bacterium]